MKPLLTAIASLCLLLSAQASSPLLAPSNPPPVVQLAWDAIPGTTAYHLYYGSASSQYTNITTIAGTNTTVSVSLPARGQTYFFAVTDVDTNGLESAFSSEVSYAAKPIPAAPILHAPVTMTVQVKRNVQDFLWADTGMQWSLDPSDTSSFYRLNISAPIVAAVSRSKMTIPALPPLPGQ